MAVFEPARIKGLKVWCLKHLGVWVTKTPDDRIEVHHKDDRGYDCISWTENEIVWKLWELVMELVCRNLELDNEDEKVSKLRKTV